MPSHLKPLIILSIDSLDDLSLSLSSILKRKLHYLICVQKIKKVVLAPPKCRLPEGGGANLVIVGIKI